MGQPEWRNPGFLEEMATVADEPADAVAAELFASGEVWAFVGCMSRLNHVSDQNDVPPVVRQFFEAHYELPSWADQREIDRTESLFDEHSVTAVTALFCASLPECYALGDEAAVLHRTGQLEDKTLYRVRQTGRFIFSVMQEGGLDARSEHDDPDWVSGRLQTLAVRLIHAIVRQLIENPEHAGRAAARTGDTGGGSSAAPWMNAFSGAAPGKVRPISQLQLAFTLLTFSYVIMRSLRRWGIRWTAEQERGYMHTWNAVGHVLGVDERLMAWSYEDGEELFALIKSQCAQTTEEGKALTACLIQAMEVTFRWRTLRTIPAASMRLLLGPETSRSLGVTRPSTGPIPHAFEWLFVQSLRTLGAVSSGLGRSVPLVRRSFEHVASGFVEDLLTTQTRTYFAPLRLKNPAPRKPRLIHQIVYRPRTSHGPSG